MNSFIVNGCSITNSLRECLSRARIRCVVGTPSPREERTGRGPGRGEFQEKRPSSPRPSPPSAGAEGEDNRTLNTYRREEREKNRARYTHTGETSTDYFLLARRGSALMAPSYEKNFFLLRLL